MRITAVLAILLLQLGALGVTTIDTTANEVPKPLGAGSEKSVMFDPSPISFHLVFPSSYYWDQQKRQAFDLSKLNDWARLPRENGGTVIVKKQPVATLNDILKMSEGIDKMVAGRRSSSICLTVSGGYRLADFSRQHTGEAMAIVVEGTVTSQPILQTSILGGGLTMTPGFDAERIAKLRTALHSTGKKRSKKLIAKLCGSSAEFLRTFWYLNKTIEQGNADSEIYVSRAQFLLGKGELQEALAYYTRAIEIDSKNPDAHSGRSEVYLQQKKYALVMRDLDRAIVLVPDVVGLVVQRGYLYQKMRKFKLAIADFSRGISSFPKMSLSYELRAGAFADWKQYDSAVIDYTKAIELSKTPSNLLNDRAWVFFKMGKLAKGLADANRALDLDPSDGYAFDTRGHIYEALGEKNKAIKDFQEALRLEPDSKESKDGLKRLKGTSN